MSEHRQPSASPLLSWVRPHRHRLYTAVLLLFMILVTGTVGYSLLEGWSLLDSLYMTVITVATVGFQEVHDLHPPGRIFTMFLIVTSIGLVGYAVSTLAAFVLEGEFNRIIRGRKMDKRIAGLKDHIILCGAGRTGRPIAEELHRSGTPFVVIERDPEAQEELSHLGDILVLPANATLDDTLRLAGIERARGLVSVLGLDKDNVFVTLSARALNPRLHIVARVISEENTGKLRRAGADEVVSPNAIGGLRMASMIIRPSVVTFLDAMLRVTGEGLLLEEVAVGQAPGLSGRSLRDLDLGRRTGAQVVAIKGAEGVYRFHPDAETALGASDILIVLGTTEQVAALRKLGAG